MDRNAAIENLRRIRSHEEYRLREAQGYAAEEAPIRENIAALTAAIKALTPACGVTDAGRAWEEACRDVFSTPPSGIRWTGNLHAAIKARADQIRAQATQAPDVGRLVEAAKAVCSYNWSDHDDDAVADIEALRAALEGAPLAPLDIQTESLSARVAELEVENERLREWVRHNMPASYHGDTILECMTALREAGVAAEQAAIDAARGAKEGCDAD